MKEKTIEETYQKKTPLEHILLRPDTYVGSIEMERSTRWILREGAAKFSMEEIGYVPALYKIFDQVLVNAADNYQRDRKMNTLKVELNAEQGWVSVHNNGKGIPVEIHKEEKIYVPELIFGHLLTGSNYNDEEKKVTGGRNGYGAKLANIFSHKFQVECGDGKNRRRFRMVWRKNMTSHGEAEVTPYSGKDYTIVTFHPEFSRFGMQRLDDDILSLMRKRVYDMAGLLPSVQVFLNDRKLPINSFLKYVDMYFPVSEESVPKIRDAEVDNERWQVVVSLSDGEFRQVSFVNSICTSKGGTHVNMITDQIVDRIKEKLEKKDKNLNVKPFQIKGHLWVFVNALVENPAFDSQTKETLTLKQSLFGSKCTLTDKMIKEILKTGVVDDIYNEARTKELAKLAKLTGGAKKAKITGIPKLEDANEAGTKNSEKCTLILTEGDSAKSLAMAGLEVIGRDYYGVFPLKGKLLNARQCSNTVLSKNQEIQNLIKIIGLQIGKNYEDIKSLRYGSIMIMSDQDTDGSHIKGLVINFVHSYWPSLFRKEGFLKQFITPLLKVSRGREVISFYTMGDFKRWADGIAALRAWKIKYYKGLGTSTDKEAQEYFQQLQRNRIAFRYNGPEDDEAMELIFSKKNAEKRKEWLNNYDPQAVMVYDRPVIGYKEFVDREFIHFSNEDNHRSIASVIDGFKPGQRKIIFACFKRNLKEEIKVAQLAGYVAEHSAYHHGEMSLTMTIVNMAQSFVGSNNINLLLPNGQFGSRNQGGKDHASARYIFTNLNRVTRALFPEPDDHTLTYIEDDGQLVEPIFYVPILPMVLINGCQGIGSGWSTFIPNHNPRDIAQMLLERIDNEAVFSDLDPWYKGFLGEIVKKEDGNYEVRGILQIDQEHPGIVHIKELPINKWTKDYKEYLEDLMEKEKVAGLREYHTKNRVHFEVEMNEAYFAQNSDPATLEKLFKLSASVSMKNMVGFNSHKRLQRYSSSRDILEQFYRIRLEYYQKRKKYLVSKLVRDCQILSNKERFILEVVEEKLIIRNKKKIKLVEELKAAGYTKFSHFPKICSTKAAPNKKEEGQDGEADVDPQGEADESKEYNYLLSMPMWNLTFQKVENMKESRRQKEQELHQLQKTPEKQLWKVDIQTFLEILDQVERQEEEDRLKGQDKLKGNNKGLKAKKNRKEAAKPKEKEKQEKKPINWDTDGESEFAEKSKAKKSGKEPAKKEKPVEKAKPKPKEEKEKTKEKEESEPNDLISRVKRKMEAEKNKLSQGEVLAAKPVNSKPKTLRNMLDDEDSQEAQIVATARARSKPAKSSNKKSKRMQLDSDESEAEWQASSQSESAASFEE